MGLKMKTNYIGQNIDDGIEVAASLNQLLADHQIYFQNLRGFHWLVAGKEFFQLHELFEKLYNEANNTIDELAERELMLGDIPLHTFEEYLGNSKINVVANLREGEKIMEVVISNISSLLDSVRNTVELADEKNDFATVSILDGLISSYEKHLWMFSTYTLI